MQEINKTRDQLIEELRVSRKSLIEQGRANLLLSDNRVIATKRFAAGIAHEINNPLGVISGFAELALFNADLSEPIRADIRVILSETTRAARILRDLMIFAGERPVETVPVDVGVILKQVLKIKSREFAAYHINATMRISSDLPNVLSDPDQLVEVLINILDNAQHAMTEASGDGEIEIVARLVEDRVSISIKDDGPGISPAYLAKIFQPFFTTKEVGKGSGLGLSLSLGMIRQHGGDLWAESSPDLGSTFHLELPTELETMTDGAEFEAPAPQPAAANGRIKRILVVNDELGFRQFLFRALSSGGNVIDLAGEWNEAWNMVQRNSYDCVILNLGLPAVNGLQLFDRIKDYDSDLAARCVFITGYFLTDEIEASLAVKGIPVLTKPFAISQIRRLVLEE